MKKIVIVDDDKKTLFLIDKMLDRSGFESVSFEDPVKALSFINQNEGDVALVIADVAMPGLSGFDLLEKIKKTTKSNNLPFVFLSALSAESLAVNAFEQGALDYIVKPVSREFLIAKIRSLIKTFEESKSRASTMIRGHLRDKPVEDLLGFCEREGLTGTVTIVQPDATRGVIRFVRGLPDQIRILDASEHTLYTEIEAYDHIRTWQDGDFSIQRG